MFDKPGPLAHGTYYLRHALAIVPVIADLGSPPLTAAFAGSSDHLLAVAFRTNIFIPTVHNTPPQPEIEEPASVLAHIASSQCKKYEAVQRRCQGEEEKRPESLWLIGMPAGMGHHDLFGQPRIDSQPRPLACHDERP